ncbi:Protein ABC1, mitochondrial [Neolecta irregularis DAH-3]|uniref:Protein ABC1, mitochondrial n=1 Tax=Neolecta irregularis (strain DAH-3) TaxID=1198029 RepID=A0A1U7LWF0_NEOID|nr:Protein ABC1, mitochondrial [Neolecta irregularis DAH-3]|eukprot:OLL27005.1 Protein ABC1, mitochondrial [Neolecta irregularis DAH-3]
MEPNQETSLKTEPGVSGQVSLSREPLLSTRNFDAAHNSRPRKNEIDNDLRKDQAVNVIQQYIADAPSKQGPDIDTVFHNTRNASIIETDPAAIKINGATPTTDKSSLTDNIDSGLYYTADGYSLESDSKVFQPDQSDQSLDDNSFQMSSSRVPSSRITRLLHYGSLAAGIGFGAINESLRRVTGSTDSAGSLILSSTNMNRLVKKLSKMRGAALKLGQMISFQDSKIIPAALQEVLLRVQDSADYMPQYQMESVMTQNLGSNWRSIYSEFNEVPVAAASIGQVHFGVLASNKMPVAVKIQYPGVSSSIDSDLNNLSLLLSVSRLLPPGLYLDRSIETARKELSWECDYLREADCAKKYAKFFEHDSTFGVPKIIDEGCGPQVLTMERMYGQGLKYTLDHCQETRDWIGKQILTLCFREIAQFRYMQTDPNWTNFLYNPSTHQIELLDFGACRSFPEDFITNYIEILKAAAKGDRESCRDLSIKLGYLTGFESEVSFW